MSARSADSTSQPTASARALTRRAEAVDSEVALLLPDPERQLLALIEDGLNAISQATTVEDAQSILARTKVIEAATRAIKLAADQIAEAAALRVRAERRVGELLRADPMIARGKRRNIVTNDISPRLPDLGITLDESSRFQRLAALPEKKFEKSLDKVKADAAERHGGVTGRAVLREATPAQEQRPDEQWLAADRFIDRCKALTAAAPHVLAAVRFGRYPGKEDGLVYDAAIRELRELGKTLREIEGEIRNRRP